MGSRNPAGPHYEADSGLQAFLSKTDQTPGEEKIQPTEQNPGSMELLTENLSNLIMEDILGCREGNCEVALPDSCQKEVRKLKELKKELDEFTAEVSAKVSEKAEKQRPERVCRELKPEPSFRKEIEEKVRRYFSSSDFRETLNQLLRKEIPKAIQSDLLRSKAGGLSLIGERIRLECLELVSKPSFQRQLVKNVVREAASSLKGTPEEGVIEKVKVLVGESVKMLLERIGDLAGALYGKVEQVEKIARKALKETNNSLTRTEDMGGKQLKELMHSICKGVVNEQLARMRADFEGRIEALERMKVKGIFHSPAEKTSRERGKEMHSLSSARSEGPSCCGFARIKERLEEKGLL